MQKHFILFLIVFSTALHAMQPDDAIHKPQNPFWVCNTENKWTNSHDNHPRTIFIPGIFACQTQAGKYMGQRGFQASTGEKVYWSRPIDGIYDLFTECDLEEVELISKEPFGFYNYFKPSMLGSLAWNTIFTYFTSRANNRFGITIEANPLAVKTVAAFSIIFSKMGLAQQRDIDTHKKMTTQCLNKFPSSPLVLYGFSRGAAVTFNAAALNNYSSKDVKAIVLEGCYDNFNAVIKDDFPLLKYSFFNTTINALFRLATDYNPEGIQPIENINRFPQSIPVLFITSDADRIVPSQRTSELIQALVSTGHPNVYYLKLTSATHPGYTMDNYEDAHLYQNVLHAFYKKFDLPYIDVYASQGKHILEMLHITSETID